MESNEMIARLCEGNRRYLRGDAFGDTSAAARLDTADNGQHPHAIVIACSDSRVIPEVIFAAGIGELFTIRVAGNVLDRHQLGSIEYAAAHLHCPLIIVLGHTGCGAVGAALAGESGGFIGYITDEIREAIGEERDPLRACEKNVLHAVERLKAEFAAHPEAGGAEIAGAVYDILTGELRFLE